MRDRERWGANSDLSFVSLSRSSGSLAIDGGPEEGQGEA